MFDEVNGLPLHPLATHAAVVLIPLAGLLGVLFAVPRTRDWARLPLALVAVGVVPAVFVAKESGNELSAFLGTNTPDNTSPVASLVHEHAERADLLFIGTIVYAVLAVAAVAASARPDRLPAAVPALLSVLLVVSAGLLAVQTYRVGDLGARAVWNPTGDQDFSSR